MATEDKRGHLRLARPQETRSAADVADMKRKIREHRLKILRNVGLGILAAALMIAGVYVYLSNKEYKSFMVLDEAERETSISGAEYKGFAGNILQISNDGTSYMDASDHLIWNQAYEFQNPIVDTCQEYAVLAEADGTQIYIMDTKGQKGHVKTNYPIKRVEVAEQGTIAVLMEANGVNYLQLYDRKGKKLAEGELYIENSGSVMDLALAEDAKKLGISLLDVNGGNVKTTIAFYNFDSVGQSEIDNMVASYTYDNMVVPEIRFVDNNNMVAFGDNQILVYSGTQRPEEASKIVLKKEVKSIFYANDHIGLIYAGDTVKKTDHILNVYNLNGKEMMSQKFSLDYTNAEFLDNGEICITNATQCVIYNLRGVKRFEYTFSDHLYGIISVSKWADYIFVRDEKIQKVRLR